MLTNNGLVKHAKKALAEKWGYVWGTFGHVLTPVLFQEKLMQYPNGVGKYKGFIMDNWLNKRTADCIGLIKSYLWWSINNPVYNPDTDVSADCMFGEAKEKGTINSFPIRDIPGLLVWKIGHIGIYIGDGQVIEANSTVKGIIQTPLKGVGATEWTHWMKCQYITYEGYPTVDVRMLQMSLNKLGYSLVVDNDFGPATKDALIHFQTNNNFLPDGIAHDSVVKAIDALVAKLGVGKKKNYIQIIQENSDGSADEWIKAFDKAIADANATGNIGVLEIFKYLHVLIEKIGNK